MNYIVIYFLCSVIFVLIFLMIIRINLEYIRPIVPIVALLLGVALIKYSTYYKEGSFNNLFARCAAYAAVPSAGLAKIISSKMCSKLRNSK